MPHLGNQAVATRVDAVTVRSPAQERKCEVVSELLHDWPSKVMLKVIQRKNLTPMTEDILAKEQARFQASRSTVEQIFNNGVLVLSFGFFFL